MAASQFQVIRSLVSAPGQPQTGEQRASENKRGLRAIDLARRQRESKEEASGPRGKTLKKANLKEVSEYNLSASLFGSSAVACHV